MNTIAELELLKARLQAELAELKQEYELVKAAKEKPEKKRKAKELVEGLKAQQSTSNSSATESVHSDLIQRLKLNLLSSFTGLNVIHVATNALPIEDGVPWFQYDVIANIEKLRFILTIISNQPINYQYSETEIRPYELKKLSIRMMNLAHQAELTKMVDFYATKPNYIGRAVQNLDKYYNLSLHRSNAIKRLLEKYVEFLNVSLDNLTGFYILQFMGCFSKKHFFTMIWSIVWKFSEMTLQDLYKFEMHEADEQLVTGVKPLLDILRDVNRTKHLTENQKYSRIHDIMIAIKDADTRIYNNGETSPNPSSSMTR